MKLHRYDLEDLENPHLTISEEIILDEDTYVEHERYRDMRDIYVEGSGFFDSKTGEFIVGLDIECTVTVPCAISLVPIEVDIETKLSETFMFDENSLLEEDEDLILVEGLEVDLWPHIWSAIMAEIPIKVVDPELETYPSGDGWRVLTEDDYAKEKEETLDPRLAKLKDFKFD